MPKRIGATTRLLVLLVEFFNHLGDFPAPRPTATVPGAAAGERKRLQEGRPRALARVGSPSRHSGRGPALPGCRGRSRPHGTWPRPLVLPQPAEAEPGAGSRGSRHGPCGDRSEPRARPSPPCQRPGSPCPEQAECDFIWLTLPGWRLPQAPQSLERPEGFVFTLTTVAFLIIHCWALPLRKALSPGAVLVGFSFMSDERVSGSQFVLQVGVSLSDFLETATKHRAPW